MYDSELEAKQCPKGDIRLVENQQTGLVYNADFRSELMVYDDHYQNEQALSPLFQEHLHSISQIIERSMGRDQLIEVGCGKGFFLEMLLSQGFDVTGFDPTYEGSNDRVQRHYFTPGVANQANGLILRHVLEHVQDPVKFLVQLKESNQGTGKVYIEVPCFDWICQHRAWFDIFYEHVNYFRLSDFRRMFGIIIESGKVFGEQYLYVVADLATLRTPEIDLNDRVRFPSDFAQNLVNTTQGDVTGGTIWGGASKGVIFALIKERAGSPVGTVIDINPEKQGKYLPSTGLLVKSPLEALSNLPKGSVIYVMNSNYMEEIKNMSGNLFTYIAIDHG
jgi:hypothetical protein